MVQPITREILEALVNCKFKAHLKLERQPPGQISDYEAMCAGLREEVRLRAFDTILGDNPTDRVERGSALTLATLKHGATFILDATFEEDRFLVRFDGVKRVNGSSRAGAFHYVPILFHESCHLRKEHKLLLASFGAILARIQGRHPDFGIVWHGKESRASKVRLNVAMQSAERLLNSLREMQTDVSEPTLILNDHCPACEFRQRCQTQALN